MMKRRSRTQRAVTFAVFATVLVILSLAVSNRSRGALIAYAQESDGKVTHTVNGNTETWRIDEPNVKKPIIEFQQIRFQPGDQVRVTAGGACKPEGTEKPGNDILIRCLNLINFITA